MRPKVEMSENLPMSSLQHPAGEIMLFIQVISTPMGFLGMKYKAVDEWLPYMLCSGMWERVY